MSDLARSMFDTGPPDLSAPDAATARADSAPRDVAAHAGVTSASGHDALRADIRRLSTMLGQTLAHHGGPELLELVEQVRRLSRSAVAAGGDDAEVTTLLSGLDTGTAVSLARAFSQYFQLANIAEQRHRARELAGSDPDGRGPLRRLMERLARSADDGGPDHAEVQAVLARTELRPVFTAHPTESSRQSVLAIVRRVATALDRGARRGARRPRRPALADRRAAPRQADRRRRGPGDRLVHGAARPHRRARAARRVRA